MCGVDCETGFAAKPVTKLQASSASLVTLFDETLAYKH